jgi:hypothetical protein
MKEAIRKNPIIIFVLLYFIISLSLILYQCLSNWIDGILWGLAIIPLMAIGGILLTICVGVAFARSKSKEDADTLFLTMILTFANCVAFSVVSANLL